ncbi:MAG: TIGR03084 family metal-binding protein [Acidimicrobiales bacterium]
MTSAQDVVADLAAEHLDLGSLLATLEDTEWAAATASPGWSVADQVGHLAYFDETAALAIADPEAFRLSAEELLSNAGDDFPDMLLAKPRSMAPAELRQWWTEAGSALVETATRLDDSTRVPWYGPEMGSKSFLSARLMETWAHGQDIADAMGRSRTPSNRLRHVAQLGVNTRGWSYAIRQLPIDESPIRVHLSAPDGSDWTWGPEEAESTVEGDAVDFCLVVTQRRHVDDTDLRLVGSPAEEWMSIAQAFAGGPTDGPPRSSR